MTVTTSLRLDEATLAEVDRLAGVEGKTRSTWMRDVVANAVLASKLVGGGDTRHRADEESAASSVGRNDVGAARAASATDLGERSHPTPPRYFEYPVGVPRANVATSGDSIWISETITFDGNGKVVPASGGEGFDRPYPQPLTNVIPRVPHRPNPGRAENERIPVPCKHPWWRRIGGVCLRCGEPVKR